jgi:hypothetical protein
MLVLVQLLGENSGSVSSYRSSITNGPACSYTCGDVWAAEAKNDFGTFFNFPTFGDYYLDIIHLEYRDDSGTALNTLNMANSIGQLGNFSSWSLSLYFKDINDPSANRVSVRSLNPTVAVRDVPEPSTFVIFALGMVGLVSRRINKH